MSSMVLAPLPGFPLFPSLFLPKHPDYPNEREADHRPGLEN
jgi:hypothetical protein